MNCKMDHTGNRELTADQGMFQCNGCGQWYTSGQIIESFLALPPESLPRVYGDSDDSSGDLWDALRLIASDKVAAGRCESTRLTLSADRDEWRNGIEITVE